MIVVPVGLLLKPNFGHFRSLDQVFGCEVAGMGI